MVIVPLLMTWGLENPAFNIISLGVGIVLILAAIPVTRYVRNLPEDMGLRQDGVPRERVEDISPTSNDFRVTGMTTRQALGTLTFWGIALARLASAVSFSFLSVDILPNANDTDVTVGAYFYFPILTLTFASIASILFGPIAGYMADRFSTLTVLFVCLFVQSVALCIVAVTGTLPFAIVAAFMAGAATSGFSPVLTAMTGDYFGRKHFGAILSISLLPFNIGTLFTPFFWRLIGVAQIKFILYASLITVGFVSAFVILLARRPGSPAEPT